MSKLVARIRDNDEQAFELLFREHAQELIHFCRHLLKDKPSAEDIVQDVFVEVWQRRETLDPEKSIRSYLYMAVKNRSLNLLRQSSSRKYDSGLIDELVEESESPLERLERSDLELAYYTAISELPEKMRLVYSLSRFERQSYAQIAEAMKISPKTVEAHISRALKHLRKRLVHFLTVFASVR